MGYRKWLAIFITVVMIISLFPLAGSAEESIINYGFIPNSGEASVSKVDLVNFTEVARYYTAPRTDPDPLAWRTSRIAMDIDGNAWVLNTGADGTNLQGSVVRIQSDVDGLTTNDDPNNPLAFGTDQAVQVLPVGNLGEMPRAIAIDNEGFIWVGFYGSGRLAKYQYEADGPALIEKYTITNAGIGFYEMKFTLAGDLFISSRNSTSAVTRAGIVTGVYKFDGSSLTKEEVTIPDNGPYSLLIAGDGTVYVTAYSNLLYIRDKDTGVWTSKTVGGPQNRGMAFDIEGNIWIASTSNHNAGTTVFSYDVTTGLPGPTYSLTSGTTPVGVGMDALNNMWVVCRSDAMSQGWIEGFKPADQTKVGAIKVGYRPYAYGDFTITPIQETYEICGFKFLAEDGMATETGLAGWEITLEKLVPDGDMTLEDDWELVVIDGLVNPATTGPDGGYCFTGLPEGIYRVSESLVGWDGWIQVCPYFEGQDGGEWVHIVELPEGSTDEANPESYYNFCNEPPEEMCETAWGVEVDEDEPMSNENWDLNGVNNWGWNIGPLTEGAEVNFELWAAAGQNLLSNGEHVGNGTTLYEDGEVIVTLDMFEGFRYSEFHLWVGGTNLPVTGERRREAVYTSAPGLFIKYMDDYVVDYNEEDDSITVEGVSGEVYVAVHIVACWYPHEILE